jgi:uncharacterized protein YbbC (DUF1343 family)
MRPVTFILLILHCLLASCQKSEFDTKTGAEQLEEYLPLIRGKSIALVANHTSLVGETHLVDTLLSYDVEVQGIMRVFVPEHGFRGDFDAGQQVNSKTDPETGIPMVSLYGKHKKPTAKDLQGIELVVFDIQDVGTRFYTYISTLHYVMEACAENGVPLLVLDRPNPHSGYVDGPVLEQEYSSFVGMHPIPVVYGLTMGELAGMINGEGWLAGGVQCDLTVIPCRNYFHGKPVSLPVKPSPNLTSDHAVMIYPSTCFFEGTVISEGRGTQAPFELFGHPDLEGDFSFTPVSIPGMSRYPKLEGKRCFGKDLREYVPPDGWNRIHLNWLLEAYAAYPRKDEFFTSYFETLAGTAGLRKQIEDGWDESRIRESWKSDLEEFKLKREPYLIYP